MLQSFTLPRPAPRTVVPSDDLPLPSTTAVARTRRGPPLGRVPLRLRAAAGSHASSGRAVRGHALSGPPASGWPRQAGRAGPRCGRGLFTEAPNQSADAGRAGGAIHPPAGLSPGAGPLRPRHRQSDRDRVRRQRPALRQRDAQLHARCGRQPESFEARRAASACTRARRGRARSTGTRFRGQHSSCPVGPSARRAQHPDQETDTGDIYEYSDTNGDGVAEKKELFYCGVGAAAIWNTSRADWCGGWTTGFTRPITRTASVDARWRPEGADGPNTASGAGAGRLRQALVRRRGRRKGSDEFPGARSSTAAFSIATRWRRASR